MKILLAAIILFFTSILNAQKTFDNFFKPSDTLNTARAKSVIVTETVLSTGAIIGLSQLWY